MLEDSYACFLHARNVAERLLRSHSAEDGSFAKKYHREKAIEDFAELARDLGFDVVKREPNTITIIATSEAA